MTIRKLLFEKIFHATHKSMKLGTLFPVTDLPACYDEDGYDPLAIQSLGRHHIVIGKSGFTFWENIGERHSSWESWSVPDVDELMLRYYRKKIYGEFATYPLILATQVYGKQLMDYVLEGRINEWNENKDSVRNAIVEFLNNHLSSITHIALKKLLAWLG